MKYSIQELNEMREHIGELEKLRTGYCSDIDHVEKILLTYMANETRSIELESELSERTREAEDDLEWRRLCREREIDECDHENWELKKQFSSGWEVGSVKTCSGCNLVNRRKIDRSVQKIEQQLFVPKRRWYQR